MMTGMSGIQQARAQDDSNDVAKDGSGSGALPRLTSRLSARCLSQGGYEQEHVTHDGQKVRLLEVVCERIEFLSAPVAERAESARAFIDSPAYIPEHDPPAQFSEADPPAPDE